MSATADREQAIQWAHELIATFERDPSPPPYKVVNVAVARALLAAEERAERAEKALAHIIKWCDASISGMVHARSIREMCEAALAAGQDGA